MVDESLFCPECGTEESGYFCRQCGTLLRGQQMVLCPRCHEVVPDAEFCNCCGQGLKGMALSLAQLAMAGEDFWVSGGPPAALRPAEAASSSLWTMEETLAPASEDLPDWLQELPVASAPAEVQARIYPALRPMQPDVSPRSPSRASSLGLILLLFLVLVGLLAIVALVIGRGG